MFDSIYCHIDSVGDLFSYLNNRKYKYIYSVPAFFIIFDVVGCREVFRGTHLPEEMKDLKVLHDVVIPRKKFCYYVVFTEDTQSLNDLKNSIYLDY